MPIQSVTKKISISTIFSFQFMESDLKGGDKMGAKFKKSLLGGLLLTLATFLVLTSLALADPIPPPQKTWDGPDGANWNIDAN